jgi:hypothetical protein
MTSDGIAIVRFDNPNKNVKTNNHFQKQKDEAKILWMKFNSNILVKGVSCTWYYYIVLYFVENQMVSSSRAGPDIFCDIPSLEHEYS